VWVKVSSPYLHHVGKATCLQHVLDGRGTSALGLLGKEAKLTLLGDVAQLTQLLDCALASCVLAAADDTTLLGLHQILLSQATGSVLGRSVKDLGLGSNGGYLASSLYVVVATVATSLSHLGFYLERTFFSCDDEWIFCACDVCASFCLH
jgi:hypothetical protein